MTTKTKAKTKKKRGFKLPRIFCQHELVIEKEIELKSAIGDKEHLTTVDGNTPDIFFSRIIFVLRCKHCKMIKIEKM